MAAAEPGPGDVFGGPKKSTQHDGRVAVEVDPSGPYGIQVEAGPDGQSAVIKAWEKVGGKFGIVQRHGGVRIGDMVVRVNELDCVMLRFNNVMAAVNDGNKLKKSITFASPATYADMLARRKGGGLAGGALGAAGAARGEAFVSAVRQARINKDDVRNPYAEYEVVCKMTLASSKVAKASTLRWSSWQRYTAFER